MASFNGQLRSNEIFSALYNMIISQQVFADNIAGTNSQLVDASRVDGGLYGDTKLFYATDALKSAPWGNDAEATNLLQTHRPPAPEVQAIVLDKFRQISLTVDNYLSKRAWGEEGAFSSFNSVMQGWIGDTKKVYDATTFNAYVGTAASTEGNQNVSITAPEGATAEETNRLEAQAIAETIANILVDLKDVSRDYNDYGFLRSYNTEDIVIVWNSKWLNKIKKFDLPTMFHNEGLIDKFGEYVLPARYFGSVNGTASTDEFAVGMRSLVEQDIGNAHYFAGDEITTLDAADPLTGIPTYTPDDSIVCKIMHKRSVPFMSAFEVGTSFFNPKALNENHYLTWGHNTLEYLKNYPMITVTVVTPEEPSEDPVV